MALESLGLPVDPHSLYVARLLESMRLPEMTDVRTLAEDIAGFIVNLSTVRKSDQPIKGRLLDAREALTMLNQRDEATQNMGIHDVLHPGAE